MDPFPLLGITYQDLKRVVARMDNVTWFEFQGTCKAAHDVAMNSNRGYFGDVNQDVLSLEIRMDRDPIQLHQHDRQLRVVMEVSLNDNEETQELFLNHDLSNIRNKIFKCASIWQHAFANQHREFSTTLFRVARFLNRYGIKARSLSWDIWGRPEELSEFMRSLDPLKIISSKMDDFDFLANVPPIVCVSTHRPEFTGELYRKTRILKISLVAPYGSHRVFDVINVLKGPESSYLYAKKVVLNFDMTPYNQEIFLELLSTWVPDNIKVECAAGQPTNLYKKERPILLFFGCFESQRASIYGKPSPIFLSISFNNSNVEVSSIGSITAHVCATFTVITSESQIEFAPNLPNFPNMCPTIEFLQLKEKIGKLLK